MSNPLLERMGVLFGEPETPNPAAYVAEFARMLARYEASVLEEAADRIATTHRARRWPNLAFVIGACEDVIKVRADAARRSKAKDPAYPDWTKEALARADRMIAGPLGQRAVEEGWISMLWDHYRRTPERPDDRDVMRMKFKAREFEEAYRDVLRGGWEGARAMRQLAESMLARRERLSALVASGASGLTNRSRAMTGETAP